MAMRKDGAVFREIRTLFCVGTIRDLTDGQLLERFATDRGETAELAFSVLVERHGPMVLRVCRAILPGPHDAQDAFQATFLVLVKRARGLWVRESLGPWLHQVAYRTASCSRRSAARHRRLERDAATLPGRVNSEASDEDIRALHEEIHRLPERFRAPIVLCDLEGLTHELAARHLGWPIGTVKSRLSRGRDRLRDRLIRRGVGPKAGILVVCLRTDPLSSLISPSMLDGTARAAFQFSSARTVVIGSATTLAQEVLRNMAFIGSLKIASAVLALGATLAGVGLMGRDQVVIADSQDAKTATESTDGVKAGKASAVSKVDRAAIEDRLARQSIVLKKAEATYKIAVLNREIAELSREEYLEWTYPQEAATIKSEISVAEEELTLAEEREASTAKMFKKGQVSENQKIGAELTLLQVKFKKEQAESKKGVLENYTKLKTIKDLASEIEKCRSDELGKKQIWEIEKAKEAELRHQIKK